MAVVVASKTTFSVAANTKSADQVDGKYQYAGPGKYTLISLGSATGLNVTLSVGGTPIVDDQPLAYFGATGSMDASAHIITSQDMAGGRVELYLRNTTGGALTCDYLLLWEPLKRR